MKADMIEKITCLLWKCDYTLLKAIYQVISKMLDNPKTVQQYDFISNLFY